MTVNEVGDIRLLKDVRINSKPQITSEWDTTLASSMAMSTGSNIKAYEVEIDDGFWYAQ